MGEWVEDDLVAFEAEEACVTHTEQELPRKLLTPEQVQASVKIAEELIERAGQDGQLPIVISACIAFIASCTYSQSHGNRALAGDLMEELCRQAYRSLAALYPPLEKPHERG